MKAITRAFVYWKNIDKDIEKAVSNYMECAEFKADPPRVRYTPLRVS